MSKLRVAVIGAGGIGGTHLRAYADWPELCEIAGVTDINRQAADEKAQKYGTKAFDNYEIMLDETKPDAVSICTPPNAHLPAVQAAAQRNLSVLCEKPPARNLAETQAIVEAMQTSKGILQFAFCHRFHQPVMQAQQMIAEGQLGRVVQIYNRFAFKFARAGSSWFTEADVAGGGVLIDTLVHSVDIFRALAGEINHVSAGVSTTLENIQVEDSASMLVTAENGAIGSLNCSWVTPVSEAEIRIYGTKGEAIIDYSKPGGLLHRLEGVAEWTQMPFDGKDRFTLQAEHFLTCVASGTHPKVGLQDGLAVMAVIDAAYRSAHNQSASIEVGAHTP